MSASAGLAQPNAQGSPPEVVKPTQMPPVTVNADRRNGLSIAPEATTPSQKIEPGGISYPPVSGASPIQASQAFEVPGENPGWLFNLSTYGAGFGRTLADRGVYLHGGTQLMAVDVVSGGHKGGTNIFNQGYWGFDVNTEKALGWKGGLFDLTFSTQFGNIAGTENGIGSVGYVPAAFGDGVRLVNFYYNQSFFDHALQFTFGRMQSGYTSTPYLSPGIHQTQWYCSFITVSCGNTAAYAGNSSKAPYDVGSWGSFITIHPAPYWYIKGGVYENQPLEVTGSHTHLGWPGRDWGLNEAAGAFLPIQVGYITTAENSPYPTNFHIGGYYDTASFPDKYYNSKLLVAALHPGAPLLDEGTSGMFAALQQTVWRFNRDRNSTRGLSLFFSGDWDIGGLETSQQQYIGGFILTGPTATRAADTVNFLISTQVFDPREKASRDALAAAHHLAYEMRDQTGLELNYGLALAPGVTVFPYTQYILNPDQLGEAFPDPKDTHAVVIGVHALIRLDVLFGLPQVQ
ncbi:carbohydrate porin [Caulobacter sp. S45]|uniref:carbohydrate porin n=1 Tax=Caulobacter sp. S45 TaxID=1641861 RepID=UPI00131B4210|nr:carbohydrate porin [Caulobacter sp. S45]